MSAPVGLTLSQFDSPIGVLSLACDPGGAVRGVSFGSGLERTMAREYPGVSRIRGDLAETVCGTLAAYFAGDPSALGRVPWSLDSAASGDGFQARVWRALVEVPSGQTITYGEIARRTGEPGAAQAAGVALNRNPIPLVLPCHRVVGSNGTMVGFGGGLERKTWLLRHEGALLI